MHKTIFCIFTLLLIIVFNSCGQNEKQTSYYSKINSFNYENVQMSRHIEDESLNKEITIIEHEIDLTTEDTGCITAIGRKIYYQKSIPLNMSNADVKTKIYEYDSEADHEKLIYEISDKKGMQLNELLAVNKALFWVLDHNGKREIQKYDLETDQIEIIKTLSDDIGPILLATDGDFLTWYETASKNTTLYVYDISNNKMDLLSDKINNTSMFNRALVNDGITAFTTLQDNKKVIQVFDIKSMKTLYQIQSDKPVVFPAANDKYLVFTIKKGENIMEQIYVYDLGKNILTELDIDNISVFSFDIADNIVYLNDNKAGAIWGINIEKQTETKLIENLGERHVFTLGRAIQNKSYITMETDFKKGTDKIIYMVR
ncbi:hypothetical protein Ami103574_13830 [Aminipila butyrica]|uniref:Lipoprotein n=1 Tax=Aminipila butyrica TaxID=433296 RepID=A0A858BZU9_9FIRM|nr:hypothetical protein [Aminipila butyrica]QIB70304.1 hypothetical protein Ami103574_13830 [Aminipila butyrica]